MEIVVLLHNIRSTHNVGSILRTAEGFGVVKAYFTGYTPYPTQTDDTRLPHIRNKLTEQIHKTALGAEKLVACEHREDVIKLLTDLKNQNYQTVALEQSPGSISLDSFKPTNKLALLLGEETKGITAELLEICDQIIEIPMHGRKESFNVSVATGITLYCLSKAR